MSFWPDFAQISQFFEKFPSDFHRFSNFNNFSNFEARNLLDHLSESPGSPLSDFTTFSGLCSVFQKIGRGRILAIS